MRPYFVLLLSLTVLTWPPAYAGSSVHVDAKRWSQVAGSPPQALYAAVGHSISAIDALGQGEVFATSSPIVEMMWLYDSRRGDGRYIGASPITRAGQHITVTGVTTAVAMLWANAMADLLVAKHQSARVIARWQRFPEVTFLGQAIAQAVRQDPFVLADRTRHPAYLLDAWAKANHRIQIDLDRFR